MQKHSLEFGKKEMVLKYACQTNQISRPNKVVTVMALIRECQPKTIEEVVEEIKQEINRLTNEKYEKI